MMINLAASITKAASKQTYYTIRFLADRARVADAYRSYAYFRWVDDILDADSISGYERSAFIKRQKSLLEMSYLGDTPRGTVIQEKLLVELIRNNPERNNGLETYLRNMLQVLDFDARRRGRLITQVELDEYTRWLAVSVTEAMHYFIGHDQVSPQNEARYHAVTGAHITHLLRDTQEDIRTGYFNIPREFLEANEIGPQEVNSLPYRAWVQERVNLAHTYFKSGKDSMARVANVRARIAGYAYIARFERVLEAIERQDYRLAPEYPQGRGLRAGMKMSGSVLSLALFPQVRK